ncbi:MAG: hypothetical protein KAS71_01805 [Bacteroidales bacterium]|nr:hypothetical protein [Bacteroidales bacterium]
MGRAGDFIPSKKSIFPLKILASSHILHSIKPLSIFAPPSTKIDPIFFLNKKIKSGKNPEKSEK